MSQPFLIWAFPCALFIVGHKVRIYKEYHRVCPPRQNWDSPNPSRQRMCPSPQNRGAGLTRLRVRGGGVPIRTTGEKA